MNKIIAKHNGGDGIFLELFGGKGRIAKSLRRAGFAAASLDTANDQNQDICSPSFLRRLKQLIRDGVIRGIWLGPPCQTWSIACRPAVRSQQCPLGLPSVPSHRQASLELGNRTMHAAAEIVQCCCAHGVPVAVENPATSLFFRAPPIEKLTQFPCHKSMNVTMCAFGARWRKITRVATWHVDDYDPPAVCCGRHGICDYSKRQHIVLSGNIPGSGTSWTSTAAAYPQKFAKFFAHLMIQSWHSSLDGRKFGILSA